MRKQLSPNGGNMTPEQESKEREKFEEWFKSETWRKFPPVYAMEVKPFQKEAWFARASRSQDAIEGFKNIFGRNINDEVKRLEEWTKKIPYDSYGDALREGLDHDDAWGCFCNDLQEHIKKLLEVPQKNERI